MPNADLRLVRSDYPCCAPRIDRQFILLTNPSGATQPDCTTADYERRYSECRPPLPGVRNMTYGWIQPHICEDRYLALPPAQINLPCQVILLFPC